MLVSKENNLKFVWLMVFISIICFANARQIRHSRYNKDVIENSNGSGTSTFATENKIEDDEYEEEAIVREIWVGPHPNSGFGASEEVHLPNKTNAQNMTQDIEQVTDESIITSTTESIVFTTTNTYGFESDNMKGVLIDVNDNEAVGDMRDRWEKSENPKAPYPPAGFQPKISFSLPTLKSIGNRKRQEKNTNFTDILNKISNGVSSQSNAKAAYQPSGYRPSKAFFLPSEHVQLKDENTEIFNSKNNNSKHPVCGSSANPLSPKPLDGEKTDPDSESINTSTTLQKNSSLPIRLSVHPSLLPRPLVYNAPMPTP